MMEYFCLLLFKVGQKESKKKRSQVLTHDATDDRGLLGNENVFTVALVQYTWWREDVKMRENKARLVVLCINPVL